MTSPLPRDLPEPADDGATDHVVGHAVPPVRLASTAGGTVDLADLGTGRTVLYLYPLTARPGVPLPDRWDAIPGARGCTAEACSFRDHHSRLLATGATAVYGVSTQDTSYQREAVDRLKLPYPILSDPGRRLGSALALPTFHAGGEDLYRRQTLIVADGLIEHVFYPVFPPDQHAHEVLTWFSQATG